MSRLEQGRSTPTRPREVPPAGPGGPGPVPPARPRAGQQVEEELSDEAIRAMEEGRADHAAGRTFTLAEIKRQFGIDS